MLFLAVFCGFLAENQREHYIEKQREKQYILSLLEDLKRDTTFLGNYISRRESRKTYMDSLFELLISGKYHESGSDVYFFARGTNRFSFTSSDGTIQQLKNAGALRLIRKQKVVDAIMVYDRQVRNLQSQDERDLERQTEFRELAGEIFHPAIFAKIREDKERPAGNPQLLTNDTVKIYKLATTVHYNSGSLTGSIVGGKRLALIATELIELLKKEYYLK